MNQTDREYLANFVKKARESRKFTQEQLCEMTGLSQKRLSDIENGRGNPTYDNLCTLLRVLDLPFSFLPTSNLSENDANLQRLISSYMSNNQKDRHILLSNMEKKSNMRHTSGNNLQSATF